MAQNLLRFVVWQNPVTIMLLVLGGSAAVRAGGVRRDLLLGIVLMLLVATVLMPFQGYGWGYRYLHGLLGNAVLLAALSWDEIAGEDEKPRARGRGLVNASAIFALLVLLPFHGWHAARIVAPYARVSCAAAAGRSPTACHRRSRQDRAWHRSRAQRPLAAQPAEDPRPFEHLRAAAQIRRLCRNSAASPVLRASAKHARPGLAQVTSVWPPEAGR